MYHKRDCTENCPNTVSTESIDIIITKSNIDLSEKLLFKKINIASHISGGGSLAYP